MIDSWFDNKGSYAEGLRLLLKHCGRNKTIYNRLKVKESQRNFAALKYELNKYRKKSHSTPIPATVTPSVTSLVKEVAKKQLTKYNIPVHYAMLPEELRTMFVKQKEAFYNRLELKSKLNRLEAEEEQKALSIIIEITRLTKFIDAVWEEIDYFLANKTLLPKGEDYSKCTDLERHKKRQYLHQSISKQKKTVRKLEKQLNTCAKDKKLTLLSKINQKKQEIAQKQRNINVLTLLLDKKTKR